jgi:CheY-like chemotaxis protein
MKKRRILIVEDDRIISWTLAMTLEDMGYEVTATVSTGEAAILKAEEAKPDLVLMDIILEGQMNGIEAAGVIRSRLNIPIIYMTAHTDEETRKRAEVTKPSGYLSKPVMKRQLGPAIEKALSGVEAETA